MFAEFAARTKATLVVWAMGPFWTSDVRRRVRHLFLRYYDKRGYFSGLEALALSKDEISRRSSIIVRKLRVPMRRKAKDEEEYGNIRVLTTNQELSCVGQLPTRLEMMVTHLKTFA